MDRNNLVTFLLKSRLTVKQENGGFSCFTVLFTAKAKCGHTNERPDSLQEKGMGFIIMLTFYKMMLT